MPTYGVTPQGFRAKTLEEIKGELEADFRKAYGNGINLTSASPLGQAIGIVSSKTRELWELGSAIYASSDPESASGMALAAVCALTGTIKNPATPSLVVAEVTLAPGNYAAGTLVACVDGVPSARFANRDLLVNTTGLPLVFQAVFVAEEPGPTPAPAGQLTAIATPVAGWTKITNPSDAVPGTAEESDEELRKRRKDELTFSGSSTFDAMRVAMSKIDDLRSVSIFENDNDDTNGLGVPPHSFEALVYDGTLTGTAVDAKTIAEVIWKTKPIGIRAFGAQSADVVGSDGETRRIYFSRPVVRQAYLILDVAVNEEIWDPYTSPQLLKEAVVKWGDRTILVGRDLRLAAMYPTIFSVSGVIDVEDVFAGWTANPTQRYNLSAGARELIDLDTSRIVVREHLISPTEV